ncbi:MAG: hypothetical protein NTY01_17880 [Verrucomicrobia bacterium]|nr:hypothetical protein [Verrucomicrobiota bacterium]
MKSASLFLAGWLVAFSVSLAASSDAPPSGVRQLVQARVNAEYGSLWEFYQDLHTHPELSFHEERTSKELAEKLRAAGLAVTEKVGGFGACPTQARQSRKTNMGARCM